MSFSSPKSASRSARKQDGSSTVVLDGIRTRRIRFVSFLSASLVIMGLTLSSIHFSMLVSKKSDVSDFLQMEISVLKILNTTKKTRISANNDKAMGNEISVGLQVPTIHGHAALVKGKKAPSMIMIRSNNETVEVATTSSIAAPFKSNCFPHNSKEWLEGPRLGNLNEPLMNDDFVKRMTVELPYMLASAGRATPYLGQTIAFESSRFVDDTESGEDPKSMRLWAVRLIYLSMLYHQHALAIPEAESLYGVGGDDSNTEICQKERQALGIGRYDFECPKAKYIIAALSNNGLGANMRSGATTILIAGLITGRIVHFVNNAPEGDKYLRRPWALASCDRKDAQCFFLPTSPCTITHKDIEDAYKLEGSEQRKLFKNGQIPHDHKDDKVWVIQLNMLPVLETPKQLSKSLHKYSKSLIDQVSETDPRLPILKAAMDHLLDKDLPRPGYNFAAANIKLTHALNFYGMRPNLEYSAKIDSVLDEIVPDDFDPENSFGLPIRGKFYNSLRYACVTSTGQSTHAYFFLASCLSEQLRTNAMEKANASRFTSIWKPHLSCGKSIRMPPEPIEPILPLYLPVRRKVWSKANAILKQIRHCKRTFL
jgi:hypothetical protein